MKFLNTTFLFTTIGLIITNVLGYHFNQQILLQDPVDDALTFKEKSNPLDWAIVTHAAFPSIQLRYREPDLCETTEGVNQYAGYLDIDDEDKVKFNILLNIFFSFLLILIIYFEIKYCLL